MTIKQEVLSVLVLLVIPILLGHSFSTICNKDKGIPNYFINGTMILYAFIQFLSIPLIFMEKPFHILYNSLIVFIIIFSIVGIVVRILKKDFLKEETVDIKIMSIIYIIATIALTVYLLTLVYNYQYVDYDDSRFVVNAVDILDTDTFFTINPATGYGIENYTMYDLKKDVIAPWAVYLAFISKFAGVKVVTMAHSILPLTLILFAVFTWWKFAGKVFEKNAVYQGMFTMMMIVLLIYTNHYGRLNYIYPSLTKLILRSWQGKAVLASIGIPLLFINMFDYFEKQNPQNMLSIIVCNLGICLMSANAVYIGTAITGGFSFVYMIVKKDYKAFLKALPLMLPNILYFVIYMIIDKVGF